MNQRTSSRFIPDQLEPVKPETIAKFNEVRLTERISRVCHDRCQDLKCIKHCAETYMQYRKMAKKDLDRLMKFN